MEDKPFSQKTRLFYCAQVIVIKKLKKAKSSLIKGKKFIVKPNNDCISIITYWIILVYIFNRMIRLFILLIFVELPKCVI
jgi:hypothetical protein